MGVVESEVPVGLHERHYAGLAVVTHELDVDEVLDQAGQVGTQVEHVLFQFRVGLGQRVDVRPHLAHLSGPLNVLRRLK